LARRKLSTGRISNGETIEQALVENDTETTPVSITTLPTFPERSPYSRVEQQLDETLPTREFYHYHFFLQPLLFNLFSLVSLLRDYGSIILILGYQAMMMVKPTNY
jgi:hypothetical protein